MPNPFEGRPNDALNPQEQQMKMMYDMMNTIMLTSQRPTNSHAPGKLIELPPMFDGTDRSLTQAWKKKWDAYFHLNKRQFDDKRYQTHPDIGEVVEYVNEDSFSRVLVVLSRMEGRAGRWAEELREKWTEQPTEWVLLDFSHVQETRINKTMESFWKMFEAEWADIRNWVEATTEVWRTYQKERSVPEIYSELRELFRKGNLPENNTLAALFLQKHLSPEIQKEWFEYEHPQFATMHQAYLYATEIERKLNEHKATERRPAKTAKVASSAPAQKSAFPKGLGFKGQEIPRLPPTAQQAGLPEVAIVGMETAEGWQPKCFNCNVIGHMAKDCPQPPRKRGARGGKGGKAKAAPTESNAEVAASEFITLDAKASYTDDEDAQAAPLSVKGPGRNPMTSRSTVRNDLINEQEAQLTKPASKKTTRERRPAPAPLQPLSGTLSTATSSQTTPKQASFATNAPLPPLADFKGLPGLSSSSKEERHREFIKAIFDDKMEGLSSASQDYLRTSFPPLDAAKKNASPLTVMPQIPSSAKNAWIPAKPKKVKSKNTMTATSLKEGELTLTCPMTITPQKPMTAKVNSLKTDQTQV